MSSKKIDREISGPAENRWGGIPRGLVINEQDCDNVIRVFES